MGPTADCAAGPRADRADGGGPASEVTRHRPPPSYRRGMQMNADKKIGQLSVSPLALGGNVFGWTADEAHVLRRLDAYAARRRQLRRHRRRRTRPGSPGNKGGESETVIGKWLAARGNRDDVVIATKVGAAPRPQGPRPPANIKAAAEDSLRRLGTDHIDLYYTHFDDEPSPVEEIIGALDELVKAGKVREIAASNISPERARGVPGLLRRARASPATSPSSRTTTWSRATPTRASWGRSPRARASPPSRTSRWPPASSPASTARASRAPESARAGQAARHLATERGQRVLAALTTSPRRTRSPEATVALAWLAARPTVTAPSPAPARRTAPAPVGPRGSAVDQRRTPVADGRLGVALPGGSG